MLKDATFTNLRSTADVTSEEELVEVAQHGSEGPKDFRTACTGVCGLVYLQAFVHIATPPARPQFAR